MARDRIPRGEVLQAAYGVLDKFKMNRTYFVKTDQSDCETQAPPVEAVDQPGKNEIPAKPEVSESPPAAIETVNNTTTNI